MRWVPYNGSGGVPDESAKTSERPRVLVTWGTSTTGVADSAGPGVPDVLEALRGLDAEVIVTVTAAERSGIGPQPAGVRVLENAPLHLLLPGASLIVHQGGFMTALSAAYHGVPQLLIPQLPNQLSDAEHLVRAGVARSVSAAEVTGGGLQAAARDMIGPGHHADAAARVRQEIAGQPAPREVARTLEDLVSAGTPHGG